MKTIQKQILLSVLAMLFSLSVSIPVFASTKTISSVSIKANHDLEAGDRLGNASIQYGTSSGGDINIYLSSETKYSISDVELVTSSNRTLEIGDEVKVKVTLTANTSGSTEYTFKGTYSSSNIKVSGGEYVSSKKNSGNLVVTIKLDPVEGEYDEPEDVMWKDSASIGRGIWDAPDYTSGYYDIILYRGSTVVTKIEDYNGTSYNFYPYMTQKGTYKFKVRTVPHTSDEKKYGDHSDWVMSDEYYLDENYVSDGTGAETTNTSSTSVGWVQTGGYWYYKYPDGSLKKNGWESIGGKWYLFDADGRMQTGWQTSGNYTYFLNNSGDMATGWTNYDDKWYYMNTETSGTMPEGALLKNSWLKTSDGTFYYMDSNGRMSEGWTQINGNWYYFYPGNGKMAVSTTIDTFVIGADGIWVK